MRNIKLFLSYDGTSYKGWQLQENGRTVQEEVEKAVRRVFKKKVRITGASRTDAGVHALSQVANFKVSSRIPIERIPVALNSVLPEDIFVLGAEEVGEDFNARFSAISKIYRYQIFNSKKRDPFRNNYYWRISYYLNVALMREEAKTLLGEHDFKCFQAKDKRERSSVREITALNVTNKKAIITIEIEANGFLYNMVRNIVGTLVDIGRGYLKKGSLKEILEGKDRKKAGPTAPPQGLFLIKIAY